MGTTSPVTLVRPPSVEEVIKHRRPLRNVSEAEVRKDWFLYLLAELDTAIKRDGPGWDADAAKFARERLAQLTARVHEIAAKLEDTANGH
jgi:hypothetical protein